jgi:hypothetical protein
LALVKTYHVLLLSFVVGNFIRLVPAVGLVLLVLGRAIGLGSMFTVCSELQVPRFIVGWVDRPLDH